MAKLIDRKIIHANSDLKAYLVQQDKKKWLYLARSDIRKPLSVWSESQESDISFLLDEIKQRLHDINMEDELVLRDALYFKPEGWDFWAFGIPSPIADYISHEFVTDVNQYEAKEKLDSFLNRYEEGKRTKIRLLAQVLLSLKLPAEDEYGFAVMVLLGYSSFTFSDGVILDCGSDLDLNDIADIAALLFSLVNPISKWWLDNFNSRALESGVSKKANAIAKKLIALGDVVSIDAVYC